MTMHECLPVRIPTVAVISTRRHTDLREVGQGGPEVDTTAKAGGGVQASRGNVVYEANLAAQTCQEREKQPLGRYSHTCGGDMLQRPTVVDDVKRHVAASLHYSPFWQVICT